MNTKRSRMKYHSTIPLLVMYNKEYLIPKHVYQKIPKSTIQSWRCTNPSSYIGLEYESIWREVIEHYELYVKYQNLKNVIKTITKVWIKNSDLLLPILKQKKNTSVLLDVLQELSVKIPENQILSLFEMNKYQFSYLIAQAKEECGISVLNRCFKKHPNQLSLREIQCIKDLYENPDYFCWPNTSIYYKAIQEQLISCSLSTFYKYIRLLKLKRVFKKPTLVRKGCQSSYPNQFFHLDTTYYKLPSDEKAALVFVSDNYSKAILGYNVAGMNKAKFVRNALEMSIGQIQKFHAGVVEETVLVTDGGAENHANCITELISQTSFPILRKVTALKDVRFSNSSIEAINKIMKRYIRFYKPQTLDDLVKLLPKIIYDYNYIRPHCSLKGLVPMDAYRLVRPIDYSSLITEEKSKRIKEHIEKCCHSTIP